jgi:hypothetical protein
MRQHTMPTLAAYLREKGAEVATHADRLSGDILFAHYNGRHIRALFYPYMRPPTAEGYGSGQFARGFALRHPDVYGGDKIYDRDKLDGLIAWLRLPDRAPSGSTYIARASRIVGEETGVTDPALLPLYTLLALTMGEATTPAHVHEAWALWKQPLRPDHWSLIPFGELDPAEAAKDQRYVDAIQRAAVRLAAGEHLS